MLRRAVGELLAAPRETESRAPRVSTRRAPMSSERAGSTRGGRAARRSTWRPRWASSARCRPARHRVRALLRRSGRHADGGARPVRRTHQPRPAAWRCASASAPPSTSSSRPPRATTRSCSRSGPSTASRSTAPSLLRSETARGALEPGRAGVADVRRAVALEPQPLPRGAALPGRQEEPAPDPAHGGRRPHGGGLPRARGLPGERAGGPDRDPRPPARAPDAPRLRCTRRWTSTGS